MIRVLAPWMLRVLEAHKALASTLASCALHSPVCRIHTQPALPLSPSGLADRCSAARYAVFHHGSGPGAALQPAAGAATDSDGCAALPSGGRAQVRETAGCPLPAARPVAPLLLAQFAAGSSMDMMREAESLLQAQRRPAARGGAPQQRQQQPGGGACAGGQQQRIHPITGLPY